MGHYGRPLRLWLKFTTSSVPCSPGETYKDCQIEPSQLSENKVTGRGSVYGYI